MAKTEKIGVKEKSPLERVPEDTVHLPVLLGIRPGVYLALFYSLILLTILFLLFLYPGLSKPGSVLVLSSEPLGAAVRVDGVYRGTTPCEIAVSRGTHPIEMTLPGFSAYHQDMEIPGRLVGSLFFPRKEHLRGTLEEMGPGAALRAGAVDYGAWSFTGEPTASYQVPQSLSEGAYRSGPGDADRASYEITNKLLRSSARFTSTKAGLRDLIRAKYTLDNGGLSASPLSLLHSIEAIGAYLGETPGSGLWLKTVLPGEMASILQAHPWYTKQARQGAALSPGTRFQGPVPQGSLNLGSLLFRELPSGTVVPGEGIFPREVPVEGFHIAETEVSLASWEAFLEARPAWRTENTPALMEQGLVTEDYLLSLDHPASESPGPSSVPGISWYAAEAYCQWLTGLLPPAWAGYEVRLPTEWEWEYAAWGAQEAGLTDMIGGHWEWCRDPYVPFPFLSEDTETAEEIGSPERVLRGGAWINPGDSVDPGTRASLPPDFCSAFVSFRPILVPKSGLSPREPTRE
ncbi:MAG: SUMF1/EgtB/PvdO family nonheme iron enzyme [Treponema sp.]|jgi:formylglycine-generating enzyme required for sulfatase activity|nr:SUMF1/EgtB/PvdO family nonheme iron enzyme [Treponema sp.]